MKSDCRRYLTILTCMLGLSLLFETTATALEQWQPDTEYNAQWGLDMINAGTAYGLGYTGSGVVVGIIDTGLDFTHPEFNAPGLFWGFNLPKDPGVPDGDGHGSHVAGIIGARRDGTGMHGVAYSSSLVIAPMLSSSLGEAPFVDYLVGDYSNFATPHPEVSIINNSWGYVKYINPKTKVDLRITDFTRAQLEVSDIKATIDAFHRAVDRNKLIVFSAGNSGFDQSGLMGGLPFHYPELQYNWLNVVALDSSGALTGYSNHAGVAENWTIAAPGGGSGVVDPAYPAGGYYPDGIYSVGAGEVGTNFGDGNGYAMISGTSMAAPHVSGAAALVWEAFPQYTAAQVAQTLLLTATDIGAVGIDAVYGWGLLNVGAAVQGVRLTDIDPDYLPDDYVLLIPFSGNYGYTLSGGHELILAGVNTYTGDTVVETGSTLVVNGSLAGRVSVDSTSTLGGAGVINNDVTLYGTLAPGNSPGVLTVTGDFTQGDNSVYTAELGGTAAGELDQLLVGGRYLIGNNVTLDPTLYGSYQPVVGDDYLLVAALNGVGGTYATVDPLTGLAADLRLDMLYADATIRLCVTPRDYRDVHSLGWDWNENQAPVAAVWEQYRPVFNTPLTGDRAPIYQAIFLLDGAGLQAASGQMSGQLIADSQAGAMDQLRHLNQTLEQMIEEDQQAKLFHCRLDVSSGDLPGRGLKSTGVIVNYNLGVTDFWRWGAGFSYADAKVSSVSGPGEATLKSYGFHLYTHYQPGRYYLQGQLGLGRTEQDYQRRFDLSGSQAQAGAKSDGEHLFGELAMGRSVKSEAGQSRIQAALLYETAARNDIVETGDGWYALSSDAVKEHRFASELSWTGRRSVKLVSGMKRTVGTKLGWVHDFADMGSAATVHWQNNDFRIKSEQLGIDALIYDLTSCWQWERGYEFELSFRWESRSNSNDLGVGATLSRRF
jgi:subtilase-type serine protease